MKGLPFHMAPSAPKRRSEHNLSHRKVFTADFGQILPIYVCKCIPGDTHRLSVELVVRFQPLVAPVFHPIQVQTFFFFTPFRTIAQWLRDNKISDFDWESYITGGVDGDDSQTEPELPTDDEFRWSEGSLLDYLYNVVPQQLGPEEPHIPSGINAWPLLAYNMIYNDYFRDENLIDEVNIWTDLKIKNRAWKKDYFTSALPFQQRGISPVMPINQAEVRWEDNAPLGLNVPVKIFNTNSSPAMMAGLDAFGQGQAEMPVNWFNDGTGLTPPNDLMGKPYATLDSQYGQGIAQRLKIDVLGNWDINDLRTAWQTQKFLEAMARVGARYTEYLKGIWNVAPRDERLQRPEFIGSSKQPIIISEVLQTSKTEKDDQGQLHPQANLAGHGITADSTHIGTYRCLEWGVIIGVMTVMPDPSYDQGINRQWLCETRYDYPNPYYMHLSERPIEKRELFFTYNGPQDRESFGGWQGIWDEYRIMQDAVNGKIRSDFAHWTLVREFEVAPTLNKSFIECDSQTGGALNPLKRIFAVPEEPGMVVETVTRNPAIRPMPFIAEPGLVDH